MSMKSLRNHNRRPTHPGAILREDVLPGLDISQGKLAELLGVSRLTVSQVLHEHRALSPDMATAPGETARDKRRELAAHARGRRLVGGAPAA